LLVPIHLTFEDLDLIFFDCRRRISVRLDNCSHSLTVIAAVFSHDCFGSEVIPHFPMGKSAFIGDPGVKAGLKSRLFTGASFRSGAEMALTFQKRDTADALHFDSINHGGGRHTARICV
jgi:hypothetical protein